MRLKLQFIFGLTFFIVLMNKSCIGVETLSVPPPIYQEVPSGRDTKLRCPVVEERGECIWQKDGKPVDMFWGKYARDDTADCSILIKNASLNFDDGLWECQVTRDMFAAQDTFTTLVSRLVVLVKPSKPHLEYNGTILSESLTLMEDQEITISCVSRYGNPPSMMKWYIGIDEIETSEDQINTVEINIPKTWAAYSFIKIRGSREMDGLPITCVSHHPTDSLPTIAESRFDIHYSPRLKLNGTVNKTTVKAIIGFSIEPFFCTEFEANPSPHYVWMHYRGGIPKMIENPLSESESGRRLKIKNVTWSDEGEYRCVAYNVINDIRHEMPSDARFFLRVFGPPEIQPTLSTVDKNFYVLVGYIGNSIQIKSRFCSRPSPRLVSWQWGTSDIEPGEIINEKYKSLPIEPIIENKTATNCYWTKLEILYLEKEDETMYTLLIVNKEGQDLMNFKLNVRDPFEIPIIASAAILCFLFVILIVTFGTYSILLVKNRKNRKEEKEKEYYST